MKIPLRLRERYGQLMPFTSIAIRASSHYRLRPLRLITLVDTGSPWTAVTPMGITMLNISTKTLSKADKYTRVRFADYTFNRLLINAAGISMIDENKKSVFFDMPSISVLDCTKKINPNKFKDTPAVLGCDFIDYHGLSLYFDPSKKIAYLEKQ